MNSAIRVTDGGGMRRVEIDRPEKADALDTGMMLEIARGECELQAQEHALVELIDALASLEIPVLALAHGRTLGAGGQQRSLLEQIAFIEEMERADAPRANVLKRNGIEPAPERCKRLLQRGGVDAEIRPEPRHAANDGVIHCRPRLGGMLNYYYYRAAA